MFDPQRLLGQLLGDALSGDFGRRKSRGLSFGTKAQLGIGALGLAIAAYEHYARSNPSPAVSPSSPPDRSPPSPPIAVPVATSPTAPPPPPAAPDLSGLSEAQADAVLLVRAMIAAAGADGHIDATERARIVARSEAAGFDAATRTFLDAELAIPHDADRIGAMTRPALTREVYAAAAMSIDLDTDAERRFLHTLAGALGLDEDTRIAIHQQIGAT